jgi:hypothetical protein
MIKTRSVRGPGVAVAVAVWVGTGVSLGVEVPVGEADGARVWVGIGEGVGAAHPPRISARLTVRERKKRFMEIRSREAITPLERRQRPRGPGR